MAGRISQFLSALRMGLVTDVPPEYQACESCREPSCDSAKAAQCLDRRCGEEQERSRRFNDAGRSGTHEIGASNISYDVPSTRLAGAPPSSAIRSRGAGEYSLSGGEEFISLPERRQTKLG